MIVPRVRSLNANLRLISAIVSAVYLLKITEIMFPFAKLNVKVKN
jgi:hypothetical protein